MRAGAPRERAPEQRARRAQPQAAERRARAGAPSRARGDVVGRETQGLAVGHLLLRVALPREARGMNGRSSHAPSAPATPRTATAFPRLKCVSACSGRSAIDVRYARSAWPGGAARL